MTNVSACGKNKTPPPSELETNKYREVTLSLRHTQIKESSEPRLRLLEDVVAKTMAENAEITIKLEGIDEIVNRDTKLKQEMVAGNPPDIFEVFGGADIKLYVKANRMLNLTPILQELNLIDKFQSLAEFTIDGQIYGIPYGGYSEGVFYNKVIFNELGIEIPKTWDELIEASETIKKSGYTPFGLAAKNAWVAGMLWNTIMERHVGIDAFYDLLTGEAKWTDPNFIKGFEAYSELVDREYFPKSVLALPYSSQAGHMLRGKAAMVFTGTWDANPFTSMDAGILRGQIGFFSFPAIPNGMGDQGSLNSSYSNGFGFSSNLTEDQIAAVKLFIANYFNEDVQKRAFMEDKLLPSMKMTDSSDMDPLMNEIVTVMSQATSKWPAFDAIVQPSVTAEIGSGLQELLGKLQTPQQVAEKIQAVQNKANSAQVKSSGFSTNPPEFQSNK